MIPSFLEALDEMSHLKTYVHGLQQLLLSGEGDPIPRVELLTLLDPIRTCLSPLEKHLKKQHEGGQ